ncbi:hypothetical protein [Streptomyces niveus]|uniref:hypothetical protein n=1 Tax=Streptomyces niveus TaxID=193462 RepID=UPI00387030E1
MRLLLEPRGHRPGRAERRRGTADAVENLPADAVEQLHSHLHIFRLGGIPGAGPAEAMTEHLTRSLERRRERRRPRDQGQ